MTGTFRRLHLPFPNPLFVLLSALRRGPKSAKAVTGDVLAKMLATCTSSSLRDLRDRAILMVAFASGGRRRSEVAGLRWVQLGGNDR